MTEVNETLTEEELEGLRKENPDQASLAIFPTPNGIAIDIRKKEGEPLIVSPDDAGRIVMSLLTASVMFQMQRMTQQAMEKAEFEQVKQMLEEGKLPNKTRPGDFKHLP